MCLILTDMEKALRRYIHKVTNTTNSTFFNNLPKLNFKLLYTIIVIAYSTSYSISNV